MCVLFFFDMFENYRLDWLDSCLGFHAGFKGKPTVLGVFSIRMLLLDGALAKPGLGKRTFWMTIFLNWFAEQLRK